MSPKSIHRLDQASMIILLLWAGAALGFGVFSAPVLFRELPSRDVAGRIAGLIIVRLDWAAWAAFGLAGLSWAGRWVAEVPEWNVLLYGDSRQDVVSRVQPAAREIILERIAHGDLAMPAR